MRKRRNVFIDAPRPDRGGKRVDRRSDRLTVEDNRVTKPSTKVNPNALDIIYNLTSGENQFLRFACRKQKREKTILFFSKQ